MTQILHIDSSARRDGSVSRALSGELADGLARKFAAQVTLRDLNDGLPKIDDAWIDANFTPSVKRSDAQRDVLSPSRHLVSELEAADHIVIGLPLYNFAIPSALKMWIDQVSRPGLTFLAKPSGFIGLLEGKTAYLVVASGGTDVQGPIDFATDYLVHMMNFLGIQDVRIVSAMTMMTDPEQGLMTARQQIRDILHTGAPPQEAQFSKAAIC